MQRIVIDTDLGNDIDDVLALALLHKLHARKEIEILGIISSNGNLLSSEFINFLNIFYKHNFPVGQVKNGITSPRSKYLHLLPLLKELYPDISKQMSSSFSEWPSSDSVLKEIVESNEDITLLMLGFSTNVPRFLENKRNCTLAHKNIRKIVSMAGHFPFGPKEYNVFRDPESFLKLTKLWKVEITFAGYELGQAVEFPMSIVEQMEKSNFDYPVTLAYRAYKNETYNRPSWDLVAAFYCAFPNSALFRLSDKGQVKLKDDLSTIFSSEDDGKHQYLIIDEKKRIQLMCEMMSILQRAEP